MTDPPLGKVTKSLMLPEPAAVQVPPPAPTQVQVQVRVPGKVSATVAVVFDGPAFEAVIGGRYGLVAFDAVERITSEGPRDLRDFVWYPVQIAFREGQSAAALLPARYTGSEASAHADERLGSATNWIDTPDGQAGVGQAGIGQHLWTLSTGEDQGLLGVRTLIFD